MQYSIEKNLFWNFSSLQEILFSCLFFLIFRREKFVVGVFWLWGFWSTAWWQDTYQVQWSLLMSMDPLACSFPTSSFCRYLLSCLPPSDRSNQNRVSKSFEEERERVNRTIVCGTNKWNETMKIAMNLVKCENRLIDVRHQQSNNQINESTNRKRNGTISIHFSVIHHNYHV